MTIELDTRSLTFLVAERSIIAPGASLKRITPEGELTSVRNAALRTYAGRTTGENAEAVVTDDPAGNSMYLSFTRPGELIRVDAEGDAAIVDIILRGTPGAGSAATPSTSSVRYQYANLYADQGYLGNRPNWHVHATHAFNVARSMWIHDASLEIYIADFIEIPGHWAPSNCGHGRDQLKSYLQVHGLAGNAHSHGFLVGTEIDGLGCGRGFADLETDDAVWEVEGLDHWPADGYDPDFPDDLGLVVGHELGHLNGGWEHVNEYRCDFFFFGCWAGSHNIMGTARIDLTGFWFTAEYRGWIREWGYYESQTSPRL